MMLIINAVKVFKCEGCQPPCFVSVDTEKVCNPKFCPFLKMNDTNPKWEEVKED